MVRLIVVLLLWAPVARALDQDCSPCAISPENRALLLNPGYFTPTVDTSGHPESPPVRPLPFPRSELDAIFVDALRESGVPISGQGGKPVGGRGLTLYVHLWEREGRFVYFLQIDLEICPKEGQDAIYESIWPIDMGDCEPSQFKAAIKEAIRVLVKEFSSIYERARKAPSKPAA